MNWPNQKGVSEESFSKLIRYLLKSEQEWLTNQVDWIIEVLCSFECCTNTFFVAVDLMDSYLEKSLSSFEPKSIHLIGATAMLIASKIEEITPFKVSIVVEKISHGKLSAKEIVGCESDYAKTLDYRFIGNSSLFVFIEMVLVKLSIHQLLIWKDVLKVVTYIGKMAMHEYRLLVRYSLEYIGCGCIYLCFKIIEQAHQSFDLRTYLNQMKIIFNLNEMHFYKVSEEMLDLAKNFEQKFNFAKNLIKYDSFSLERVEDKYV